MLVARGWDRRDTRDEVLAEESRVAVSGCDITHDEWVSDYDGATCTASSDVAIDHKVALADAWDSGAARTWGVDTRERFANDLDDPRSLVAVTNNVNQSKGDQDPAEWLPDREGCRYVEEWAAVNTLLVAQCRSRREERPGAMGVELPRPVGHRGTGPDGQGPPPNPEPEPEDCDPATRDFCFPRRHRT